MSAYQGIEDDSIPKAIEKLLQAALTPFYHFFHYKSYNHIHGNHSSEGKGDRRKRTSDCARTQDLRFIAEFQPREPRRPVEIPRPPVESVPLPPPLPLNTMSY